MVLLQVLGRGAARPVDQVQVHVVQPQALEAGVDALRHALVPRVVELGGDPDVGARDPGVADGGADLGLVAVGEGRVDVAVAVLEGGEDGVVDLVGAGLPGAEADDGDLGARVEGRGAPGVCVSGRSGAGGGSEGGINGFGQEAVGMGLDMELPGDGVGEGRAAGACEVEGAGSFVYSLGVVNGSHLVGISREKSQ